MNNELNWSSFEQDLLNKRNQIEKAWEPTPLQSSISPQEKADLMLQRINETFNKGLIDELTCEKGVKALDSLLEKAMNHKYFKREGTPGNYKYFYTEAEYNQAKGKGEKKDLIDLDTVKKMNRKDFGKFLNTFNFNSTNIKDEVDISKLMWIRDVGRNMNQETYYTDGKYIYRDPYASEKSKIDTLQRFEKK